VKAQNYRKMRKTRKEVELLNPSQNQSEGTSKTKKEVERKETKKQEGGLQSKQETKKDLRKSEGNVIEERMTTGGPG